MIRKTAIASLAVGALGGLALSAPASAAPERAVAKHCVITVEGRSLGCFASLAEADRVGTDAKAPLLVLARLSDRTGYDGRGATLTVKGSRACSSTTGDLDLGLTNLAVFGFDNKTSSFYTRNRCDMKGYTGYSFGGTGFARYQDADQRLVKFNNNISSIKLS